MATTVTTTVRNDGWIECGFDASAAESADLVSDPGDGFYIEVKDFVVALSVAGTFQLKSGTVVLTGAIPLAAGTPLELESVHCAASEKLCYTAGTGSAKGRFVYRVKST